MTYEYISNFLREKLADKNAILGLSGGIDSSLVLAFLSQTINNDRIKAYFMPDNNTPSTDYEDIKKLSQTFSVKVETINISQILDAYVKLLNPQSKTAIGNIKSRARMILLYYYANVNNGLVIGTTNYTELITGYFTKYGDGGVDIEPIINLTKTEVREEAKRLGVPSSIIEKPPTAGLWEGQKDEDELGFTYTEIDRAIEYFRKNGDFGNDPVSVRVKELYLKSLHKRNLPYSPGEV
ncbi:NAD+ synthase [Cuniculiplasma sp. SKW3]|uniref:NAD+ synthase n=1 Tax=Cuniculiplasma sp. SKW3 TaxID=3400170 RepID=UPI003FD5108A